MYLVFACVYVCLCNTESDGVVPADDLLLSRSGGCSSRQCECSFHVCVCVCVCACECAGRFNSHLNSLFFISTDSVSVSLSLSLSLSVSLSLSLSLSLPFAGNAPGETHVTNFWLSVSMSVCLCLCVRVCIGVCACFLQVDSEYMISFEDNSYVEGYSPALEVPQRYVLAWREPKRRHRH